MNDGTDIRARLHEWIRRNARSNFRRTLTDETPLLKEGVITSLQVMDLLLFIEELRGSPLEIGELKAGAIRDINSIQASFFEDKENVA